MAIFCKGCLTFRGSIKTCRKCEVAYCSDCRASFGLCKDCFLETHSANLINDYKTEKIIIDVGVNQ